MPSSLLPHSQAVFATPLLLRTRNLSSHLAKLEEAHYVHIEKTFKGKYPLTICSLTKKGRQAFDDYVSKMRVVSTHSGSNGNNS